MNRAAWQAMVHGVVKSQMRLSVCMHARTHTHTHTHTQLRALHEHGIVLDATSYTEMSDSSSASQSRGRCISKQAVMDGNSKNSNRNEVGEEGKPRLIP